MRRRRFSRRRWRRGCPGCSGRSRPASPAGAARCAAGGARSGRHVAGGQELRGRPGRTSARRRAVARPASSSSVRLVRCGPAAPRCAGSRDSSHRPIDVAQVADGAVDAAFVGEVRRPAGLGQHRVVEFDADQSPGAAGDVGEVRVSGPGRRRRRRRCRASRRWSPSAAGPGRVCAATAAVSVADHGARAAPPAAADRSGRPRVSIRSVAHCPVRASSSPVVEALVSSVTRGR